jgi:hypothetical protein
MLAIKDIILGTGVIIRDKRTLRGMSAKGHIVWPVVNHRGKHTEHPYINDEKNGVYLPTRFEYNGKKYQIKYMDGCIYPFVVKQEGIK